MTERRINLILLFVAAILAAASCGRDPLPGNGYGGIVLSLNSSHALRMETKSDADELLDGSRFSNLLVVLTDNSGKVVNSVYKEYVSPLTLDTIKFEHLLPGN